MTHENQGNGGNPGNGGGNPGQGPTKFQIQIDREHFTVTQPTKTGTGLRQLPNPAIGPDRDLFEVVPGGSDKKIADGDTVQMKNGLRFFTAPAQINPGRLAQAWGR